MPRRAHCLKVVATVTTAGLCSVSCFTPVTPAEQRERLPPAAACADPIEGVWVAYAYQVDDEHWLLNKMELRRASPSSDEYASTFTSHTWSGGPAEDEPPECREGVVRAISHSSGVAQYRDRVLIVRGTQLGPLEMICGQVTPKRSLGVLTGRVSPERNEFTATMTTKFGSKEIVWRRIRCLDTGAAR